LFDPRDWTLVDAHRCPKCELVFATRAELEDHLATEHPGAVEPPPD
jgi:uncharacterized C2H2 Zn-finger protein